MTPRQGFIAACIEMAEIDNELSAEEVEVSMALLQEHGFSDQEFDEVMNLTEEDTLEENILSAIKGLDEKMKLKLVEVLKLISSSDGTGADEFEFLQRVEKTLGLPVDM